MCIRDRTYTAFVPYEPRVAIAVSEDLQTWQRLGILKYEMMSDGRDLNKCGNKDAALFSEVVSDALEMCIRDRSGAV